MVKSAFLAIIFLIVPSCSSLHSVGITNSTAETIQFQGQFGSKLHDRRNLGFTLQFGAGDLWMYELGYFEKKF